MTTRSQASQTPSHLIDPVSGALLTLPNQKKKKGGLTKRALREIVPTRVGLVKTGANRESFFIRKSLGDPTMPSALDTAIAEAEQEKAPSWATKILAGLGLVQTQLAKAGLSDNARVAAARAYVELAPFKGELPEDFVSQLQSIAGSASAPAAAVPAVEVAKAAAVVTPAVVVAPAEAEKVPAWAVALQKSVGDDITALKTTLAAVVSTTAEAQKTARLATVAPLAKALGLEATTLDAVITNLPPEESKKLVDNMARMTKVMQASPLFKELGSEASTEAGVGDDNDRMMDARAREIMKADPTLDYALALSRASGELNVGISSRKGGV